MNNMDKNFEYLKKIDHDNQRIILGIKRIESALANYIPYTMYGEEYAEDHIMRGCLKPENEKE